MGRLDGKVCVITGAGGGMGRDAAVLFVEEGAKVCVADVRLEVAEETVALCAGDAFAWEVDVADENAVAGMMRETSSRFGGIDVLYNNAAGFGFSPFANMTLALWRHVMSVELDIIFHTTSVAWAHLCDGGGAIINTGSYSALRGIGPLGQVAHAAAKGGVIAMTRSLAVEGARHGVRANSISPGFVSTPSTDAAVDDTGRAWQIDNHLIQRPGKGIDVAHLAVYLASDESSWVTGQNISVDGGATAGWRDDAESDRIVALYS
jgi:NAD(P)-dependent dehydrogenase (short-subunit alcohol dehydrogenase family)